MSWPWMRSSRHDEELAAANAETERQRRLRKDAEQRAKTAEFNQQRITEGYAVLFDENQRVISRNQALCSELESAQIGSGFDAAQAKRTADRIARLQRAVARGRAEAGELRRSAEHLQQRLDDAFSLDDPKVAAGARWQDRREDKKAVTS